jgi:inward rectifier potassium channel
MAIRQPVRRRNLAVQAAGRPVQALGGRSGGLSDLYHGVLRMPLWGLLLLLASVYVGLNLIFASLYLLDPHGVANLKHGDFIDAFFFSIQTFSTVGYGVMTPLSLYANMVVVAQCFLSLLLTAVTTGVVFAHVSKPTARVMFSNVATVTPFEGVPHLMFRAANERSNRILETEVMLSLARQINTVEGQSWRRLQDLMVTRSRSPLFALSWTIMHRLDESSPLFGATSESLLDERAEIVVVISGVDDIFAQRIHARHVYSAADIIWDKEFVDVLSEAPDGRRVLDYRKFHDVRDVAPLAPH